MMSNPIGRVAVVNVATPLTSGSTADHAVLVTEGDRSPNRCRPARRQVADRGGEGDRLAGDCRSGRDPHAVSVDCAVTGLMFTITAARPHKFDC